MAFSRSPALESRPDTARLTADMTGIGMNFAVEPNFDAPIEETLVYASAVGMVEGDLRVLAVLTTWLGRHHEVMNADRLVRCVKAHPSERVHAYWAGIAAWLSKDRRLARLTKLYRGVELDLLSVGTEFQLTRRGEDERFRGSPLRVPAGTLRERDSDIVSQQFMVRSHAGYRNRVLMGPTWRADVWTVLERYPDADVAEVARRAKCSFATAWQVAQDFRLLHGPGEHVAR